MPEKDFCRLDGKPRTREYAFEAAEDSAPCRLDVFLSCRLREELSREKIKKAILGGRARIDGVIHTRPGRMLLPGERVELTLPAVSPGLQPEAKALSILYQDEDLVVLNKPAGISVHPAPAEPAGTLAHRLLARFPSLALLEGDRPGIVHRLDKDTTGIMLAALNEQSRLRLAGSFAARLPRKEYLALVYGVPARDSGVISAPIGRHGSQRTKMAVRPRDGRPALSEYRTLYADPGGRFSLLAVLLHTGRTHQIRVHLAHIGHPVIGDGVYADPRVWREALGLRLSREEALEKSGTSREFPARRDDFRRALAGHQLLHAWKLDFPHPRETDSSGQPQKLSFCCPPPEDFIRAGLSLSTRLQRLVLTGNPGCGKSSVLSALRERGLPVWSADQAVAALYAPGADGWQMLRGRFGQRFLEESPDSSGGAVNKKALFAAMCGNEVLRLEVEALVHPLVRGAMDDFFRALDTLPLPFPWAAAEVPLYFEALGTSFRSAGPGSLSGRRAGASGHSAPAGELPLITIGIHCPLEIRSRRLSMNRGWTEGMIARMEGWQLPEDKKMSAADLVLDNSGGMDSLSLEVEKLLKVLRELRAERQKKLESLLRGLVGL
jgi:23S rRNA pseudouridine1911/1915/1917 synthase